MKKFYERLCRMEAFIARTFLVLMVTLIFTAGFARLAGHPMNWAVDAATCIFAWACFFSADVAWRQNRMMAVDILTARLSERGQKIFRMVNYVILTAFLIYLVPTGLWLSYISRERSFQGVPEVSYSWVTMSIPVCGTMLLVTTILKIRDEAGWGRRGSRP